MSSDLCWIVGNVLMVAAILAGIVCLAAVVVPVPAVMPPDPLLDDEAAL